MLLFKWFARIFIFNANKYASQIDTSFRRCKVIVCNMPTVRRRHKKHAPNLKPIHNTPNSKWRATCQLAVLRARPKEERKYGDVQKICRSLRMPVTPQCLGQWLKVYRAGGKLSRKPCTGPRTIMDADPVYREA